VFEQTIKMFKPKYSTQFCHLLTGVRDETIAQVSTTYIIVAI